MRMGAHCHQLAIVIVLVLLASTSQVVAIRRLGVFAGTDGANASSAEQARELAEGNAAAAARFDASKEKPTAATGSSSPSTVFDPDRMSKRRVRRGSDPIHNKC
ncbi:hypothetical protein GUJ93_ZPchr0006g42682 [Zizania palustris]|uniref:Uncharacterized protein n=1 Tax=Zizania palustris TaxID=103762 RepID=A0A8J5SYQ8_ZIZPA|nr:hypothetical protein GUJ93_ZPchr0006g42682 [Zizania palustris]